MIETHKTFCRFCHVFCGLEVDVEDDRVLAVRGDRDNAVSQGYSCQKGRAEVERIYHPDRILMPQKRVDGGTVDLAPEQALDEIAAKLREIVAEHGPGAVAAYAGCGGHRTSTGGPWFLRKWLDALGSPGLYTSMTIDSPSLFLAMHRLFGSPVAVNLFDIDNADVAMFVGTNPTASHMLVMPQSNPTRRLADAQKRGMQLIVVDPRRSDVARRADLHLQLKPGEDATLLAGIIKVILDRKLYDAEYVGECVSGIEELQAAVKDFDLAYVARRTQVPGELVERAAEIFADAETGGAQSGTGLHMARHQNLTTQLVMTLNALCGRYDRRGGICRNKGVLGFELPDNMGPAPIPHFSGPQSRIRGIRGTFSLLGMYNEMPTNTLTDEILTPGEGKIRALFVNGGNPALVFADEASTLRALQDLDLLVVNDLFMSATAKFADYVLPVKHPFERTDVPRLMDGTYPFPFSQHTPPLVSAPEGTMEEWEIFWELATRLGIDLQLQGISMDRKPSADELLDSLHSNSRIPLDEVRKYPGGHVWGEQELSAGGMIPNALGHEDGKMAAGHPEVIAELREVRAEPLVEGGGYQTGDEFGFRMITYRMKEAYCTTGQNLPSLRAKRSYNPVLMNPAEMASIGVADGDVVVVDSGYGRVEGIVEGTEDLAPGVIALAHGWGDPSDERGVREKGCNVQRLIPDDQRYDPITGLAQQSAVAVNVRAGAD
ncbi:MAG: molybdopterin-dependent oxidoreductase [Deltaproteobacteria bacterium]|nr:molybdopterin-dependent oxidoreductase [Deltaproteobacteria bacterium]MBW2419485.1 molybdopterin-dependent oxidoreductase [Deltaproteobacteria bacterium]